MVSYKRGDFTLARLFEDAQFGSAGIFNPVAPFKPWVAIGGHFETLNSNLYGDLLKSHTDASQDLVA